MKTAKELYEENLIPVNFMTGTEFAKALKEHDKEIIGLIDEHLLELEELLDVCIEEDAQRINCGRCKEYYKSKAELKLKIEEKL